MHLLDCAFKFFFPSPDFIEEENNQNKSQYDVIIARLEKELRVTKELRISERDYLQKQYEELCQKVWI